MNVTIYFPMKTSHRKNKIEKIKINVILDAEVEEVVAIKLVEKYVQRLKSKFFFEKVVTRKNESLSYEFICKPNHEMKGTVSETEFMLFLSHIGFIGINNLSEFEQMERQWFIKTYREYSVSDFQKKSIKKYDSGKVLMRTKEFNHLYQKLHITRNTLEQVHFQAAHSDQWLDKIKNCDTILDFIDDYYWSIGPFVMINKKVKKELYYFSNFYDNMKDTQQLNESRIAK